MAGNASVPNIFATQGGNIPASQLDTNWNALRDYLNVREIGFGLLTTRPASGTHGQYWFATDTLQLFVDNGTAWVMAASNANTNIANGTAYFSLVSTTVVQLGLGVIPLRVNGNWIMRSVSPVISITNAGLAASTVYYAYAFDNAGVTTLELSLTGHATDAQFGVEIKTGDATRTLVGLLATNTLAQFSDSGAARLVLSWFNRVMKGAVSNATVVSTTGSSSFTELNATFRASFLIWAGQSVCYRVYGGWSTNTAGAAGELSVGFDSTTVAEVQGQRILNNGANDVHGISVGGIKTGLTEGTHYMTVLGRVPAGGGATISWDSGGGVGNQGGLAVVVSG